MNAYVNEDGMEEFDEAKLLEGIFLPNSQGLGRLEGPD